MSFLTKLFGKKKAAPSAAAGLHPPVDMADCPHMALGPRWDSAADIGHEDRATSFICGACHKTFTPAEAEQVRTDAAQRLRTDIG